MTAFAAGVAALVALGVVVGFAFGADALWVYAFFAVVAAGTAVMIGVGGGAITEISRRWFEHRDRPHRR